MCFLKQSNKMKTFQMDNTKPSLKDMKINLNNSGIIQVTLNYSCVSMKSKDTCQKLV